MRTLLGLRSCFSLGCGTASPEALCDRAVALGWRRVGIADTDNLYGAVRFVRGARERGLEPVVGAEITDPAEPARSVLVLARGREGYEALCRLVTRRKLEGGPRWTDWLAEAAGPCHLLVPDPALARDLASRVPRDRLHLAVSLSRAGETARRALAAAATDLGTDLVPVADSVMADPSEHALHRLLTAVARNGLVTTLPAGAAWPERAAVPRPDAVPRPLQDSADRLGEDSPADLPGGRPILPRLDHPAGETPYSVLARRCFAGLDARLGGANPEALARLTQELAVIERLSFADYFLVVSEIVEMARARGIPHVGRGSGASSLVAFLLGITDVDPLAYRIRFERFLNLGRSDCPDIDVDLCWKRRDEVLAAVYGRFGHDRTAMISTHVGYRLRSAFREAAKAHGVPPGTVDRASRALPYEAGAPLPEVARAGPAGRAIPADEEPWATLLPLAERLRGLPRHLGIHPGGMVVADRALTAYVPLERAAKGIVVTQYEMEAVEDVGLVKMDLLGNRALTTVRETLDLVEARTGARPALPREPLEDPATADLVREGRTLGVCQLESPAMRHLLRMLRPADTRDLARALALLRPGPAGGGMKEEFVRRARGLAPVPEAPFGDASTRTSTAAWGEEREARRGGASEASNGGEARLGEPPPARSEPAVPDATSPAGRDPLGEVASILADSFGIMLYEDDAMLVAAALAGIPIERGDKFRKAIARVRTDEQREALSRVFLDLAGRNGVPRDVAAAAWVQMAKFNSYSFCKAHAAGYAQLAARCAWLKSRFPAEYHAAVMNHHGGMYDRRVHVEEARRQGVAILPPCVNRSGTGFAPERGALRVGLDQVGGLSERAIRAILAERARGPFGSVHDLLSRVPLSRPEAEALALAGAYDSFGVTRPQAAFEAALFRGIAPAGGAAGAGGPTLLPAGYSPAPALPLRDFSLPERLRHELAVLGLTPTAHPMTLLRGLLPRPAATSREVLAARAGRPVRFAGLLAAWRTAETAREETMEFVTLEDEWGVVEVTLFPAAYRRFAHLLGTLGPYVVEGRVEDQYGAISVSAARLERVDA
ncbi:MAG: PHP domain-containing protein [Planctomycetales bacterium]|nr:PHP domain-containing protein [Planctomycetales bacterium]